LKGKKGIREKRPLQIGLTGGIGAGKSLALSFFKERGVPVLQTDVLGHQLLEEKRMRNTVLKYFGDVVLGKNGEIDRKKLGQKIFQNPRQQKLLNEIMHPVIRERVGAWIQAQARKKPCPMVVVVEVPLIFERGYYRSFDGVISVSSPRILRRKRLLKRGWSLNEIFRREKSQWSQTQKNRKADWVIFNQRSQKDLKYAVAHWLEKLR
jgi:dephospho-CoA kinase